MTPPDQTAGRRLPPGPPPRRGGLLDAARYAAIFLWNPFGFVGGRFATYGDIYYAPSGGVGLYVVRRPEHVRDVLVTHADAFTKGHSALRSISRALGDGLLTSDGEVWRLRCRPIWCKCCSTRATPTRQGPGSTSARCATSS
jgi:cytochrome P450